MSLWAELGGLPPLPAKTSSADSAQTAGQAVDLSIIVPARNCADTLESTVEALRAHLASRLAHLSHEIILVPNAGNDTDETPAIASRLASRFPEVRVETRHGTPGKGAAVRTGYAASRGRTIAFTDADLPYDLDFLPEALGRMSEGYALVTANRRLHESVFDFPVSVLPLANRRHQLGLLFNRAVRLLLPVPTTDTQAGLKIFSREFADIAFARMTCPGFFFDLELFLAAQGAGLKHAELPVTLKLNSEKSTVRVLRQSVLAVYWLARIFTRARFTGAYQSETRRTGGLSVREILRRYRDESLGTRLFLALRTWLTPYARMASELPPTGRVLDLGCGHGILALMAAMDSSKRQVFGSDHDESRIRAAGAAARKEAAVSNVRFERGPLLPIPASPGGGWNAITLIDVMHYFAESMQRTIFLEAYRALAPGGRILVREVDPSPRGLRSAFNRTYEKVATTIGFTRSERKSSLTFRAPEGWVELLEASGFKVRHGRCSSLIFADVLFVGTKPVGEAQPAGGARA